MGRTVLTICCRAPTSIWERFEDIVAHPLLVGHTIDTLKFSIRKRPWFQFVAARRPLYELTKLDDAQFRGGLRT